MSTGQEAVSVGSASALKAGDFLGPAIRNIGSLLARGMRPYEIFVHFMGRASGPTHGRNGVLQIGDLSRALVAPISHLGTQVAVMAGVAYAAKLRELSVVALTYVGDGGIATGAFHEGLNFAAVHGVPLVVVLENNQFAFSTSTERAFGSSELYPRFAGYGVPAVPVDGNDVLEVLQATDAAVEHARAGKGPTLIEARTFRMAGHALQDDMSYVPEAVREEWKEKDPLARFQKLLRENELLSAEEEQAILQTIEETLKTDLEEAERDPLPDPSTLREGVYA